MSDGLTRLLVESMRDIAHLNTVLKKRNRKVAAQHVALSDTKRRNEGLLNAVESIQQALNADNSERAKLICDRVLRYDERR